MEKQNGEKIITCPHCKRPCHFERGVYYCQNEPCEYWYILASARKAVSSYISEVMQQYQNFLEQENSRNLRFGSPYCEELLVSYHAFNTTASFLLTDIDTHSFSSDDPLGKIYVRLFQEGKELQEILDKIKKERLP